MSATTSAAPRPGMPSQAAPFGAVALLAGALALGAVGIALGQGYKATPAPCRRPGRRRRPRSSPSGWARRRPLWSIEELAGGPARSREGSAVQPASPGHVAPGERGRCHHAGPSLIQRHSEARTRRLIANTGVPRHRRRSPGTATRPRSSGPAPYVPSIINGTARVRSPAGAGPGLRHGRTWAAASTARMSSRGASFNGPSAGDYVP